MRGWRGLEKGWRGLEKVLESGVVPAPFEFCVCYGTSSRFRYHVPGVRCSPDDVPRCQSLITCHTERSVPCLPPLSGATRHSGGQQACIGMSCWAYGAGLRKGLALGLQRVEEGLEKGWRRVGDGSLWCVVDCRG